jgi:GH24 family phage-related lysozyme (muramidase)
MTDYREEFIEYIKKTENDPLRVKGTNAVHASPEGGLDTVGYGHKLTPEEAKTGKVYGIPLDKITPEKADQILRMDLDVKEQELRNTFGRRYTMLSPKQREMLLDFSFNLGTQGMIKGFPKFTSAVLNNDMETASKEYKRNYTDAKGVKKPLARNEDFYKLFFEEETPEEILPKDTSVTLERGDTLYSLAKKNNIPVQALMKLNNIKDPTKLMVGQKLRVR